MRRLLQLFQPVLQGDSKGKIETIKALMHPPNRPTNGINFVIKEDRELAGIEAERTSLGIFTDGFARNGFIGAGATWQSSELQLTGAQHHFKHMVQDDDWIACWETISSTAGNNEGLWVMLMWNMSITHSPNPRQPTQPQQYPDLSSIPTIPKLSSRLTSYPPAPKIKEGDDGVKYRIRPGSKFSSLFVSLNREVVHIDNADHIKQHVLMPMQDLLPSLQQAPEVVSDRWCGIQDGAEWAV
ncbi:hypothetical protein ACLOAV_010785 [Pseudogymnoascus australis]